MARRRHKVWMTVHPDDPRRDLVAVRQRLQGDANARMPTWVTVHPTDRCNHRCSWCWYSRSGAAIDVEAAIEALDALVAAGATQVTVSGGGEPLLHPHIAELMAALAGYTSVERRLYTHGGLVRRYVGPIAAAFDYVRISIDAGDAATYAQVHGVPPGSFAQVVSSASELVRRGVPTGLSTVVTDDNERSVAELFDICAENDIPYLFLKPEMRGLWRQPMPSVDVGRRRARPGPTIIVRRHEVRSDRSRRELPDRISSLSVTMTPDGHVRPCCHCLSDEWSIVHICDRLVDGLEGSRGDAVRRRYARHWHSCRMHDAWRLWSRSGTAC